MFFLLALLFTLEFQYLYLPSRNGEGEYRVNNKLKHFFNNSDKREALLHKMQ